MKRAIIEKIIAMLIRRGARKIAILYPHTRGQP